VLREEWEKRRCKRAKEKKEKSPFAFPLRKKF
jgi:hypothetical protein